MHVCTLGGPWWSSLSLRGTNKPDWCGRVVVPDTTLATGGKCISLMNAGFISMLKMVASVYGGHLVSVTLLHVFVDDMRSWVTQWWCGAAYRCDANFLFRRSGETSTQGGTVMRYWILMLYLTSMHKSSKIFLHDGTPPHTANVTNTLLQREAIDVMDWPSRSPNLNPIEYLWDHMKQQLNSPNNIIRNIAELRPEINRIWDDIPQAYIQRLIQSWRRHVAAVIASNGDFTRYWQLIILRNEFAINFCAHNPWPQNWFLDYL